MYDSYPKIIGEEAFLIVSAAEEKTGQGYLRVLHQSQATQLSENKIPAYVLRNQNVLLMRTA